MDLASDDTQQDPAAPAAPSPAMAPPSTASDQEPDNDIDDLDATELIQRFEREHVRPDDIKDIVAEMAEQRIYVHTEANLPTTANGVATNYILKYQWIHQAMILARDPSVSVRPKKKLGQLVPVVQQLIQNFARTMEYLIQHTLQEIDLRRILDGAIQDIDTTGIVFIKLRWIEDLGRDPLGTWRPNDFCRTLKRLQRLEQGLANGDYAQDSPEAVEANLLATKMQEEMEAEMWRRTAFPDETTQLQPMTDPATGAPVMDQTGKPVMNPVIQPVQYPEGQDPRKLRWQGVPTPAQISELPCFRGFVADVVDADDVVWDWRIKRPEMFHRCAHVAVRTWMTEAEIREEFDIDTDDPIVDHGGIDRSNEALYSGPAQMDDEVGEGTLDAPKRRDAYAVWERQDRQRNMVFTWVQGSSRFLRVERKQIATSFWYDLFPIYFNRASGRFLPVSNTTLGRPLQDEINTVRTHKRSAKRAAYNRYIVEQDILGDGELDELRRCPPEGWVPTVKKVADLREKIFQINGKYDPEVHDVIEERQELSSVMGIPAAATGQTRDAADSATEASIANQTSGQMGDRHRWMLECFIGDMCTFIGEVLNEALPEDNAKAIAGADAVWPMMDRAALWQHLEVSVEAGSTGKPDKQHRLDALEQSVQIGNAMGIGQPGNPRWDPHVGLRRLADINDWREDPEQMLMPPLPPPPPPMMPPPGPPGPNGPSPGGPPPRPGPPGPMMPPPEPPPPPGAGGPVPPNVQQDPDAIPMVAAPTVPSGAQIPGLTPGLGGPPGPS